VAAPLAAYTFAAFERGVLDTLGVNLNVFCTHRKISPVYAVVHLIVGFCPLEAIAQFALELEEVLTLVCFVLPSFEHIVAL
jgi:hypothetical protein